MARCLLFVYGLLQPSHRPPRDVQQSWSDAVRGKLFDLGPYPAADAVGEGDDWFEGAVLDIDESLLAELDDFEDVPGGLYVRKRVTTRDGHEAWVYQYNRTIPPGAPRIDRWPS